MNRKYLNMGTGGKQVDSVIRVTLNMRVTSSLTGQTSEKQKSNVWPARLGDLNT